MDRGAWWAVVHGVSEKDTTERLSTAHLKIGHVNAGFLSWFTFDNIRDCGSKVLRFTGLLHQYFLSLFSAYCANAGDRGNREGPGPPGMHVLMEGDRISK